MNRDLRADGSVQILRLSEYDTPESTERFEMWAKTYVDASCPLSNQPSDEPNYSLPQVLFNLAPEYERAVRAGRDALHIWTVLKKWREEDPEEYFGGLGSWADQRLLEFDKGMTS